MKLVLAAALLAPRPVAPVAAGRAALGVPAAMAPALSGPSTLPVLAAAAAPDAPEPVKPAPAAMPSSDDMQAAMEAQTAYLRPVAARTGMNITVLSIAQSLMGWAPNLADLLEYAAKLKTLRAEPGEAELAVTEEIAGLALRRDGQGRPNRDDLENMLLQASDPASAVEISRNGFFMRVERAVEGRLVGNWAPDLSGAEWTPYGEDRVVIFLGRVGDGRPGDRERVLAVSMARFGGRQSEVAAHIRRIAAWPKLSDASRAAVTRVADELAAAGW